MGQAIAINVLLKFCSYLTVFVAVAIKYGVAHAAIVCSALFILQPWHPRA